MFESKTKPQNKRYKHTEKLEIDEFDDESKFSEALRTGELD